MKYVVRSDSPDLQWGLSGDFRILQNVLNIIRTKKYEVPFMRDFGLDTNSIDRDIDYVSANIMQDIASEIAKYETRCTITGVEIIGADENGNLIIAVDLEV